MADDLLSGRVTSFRREQGFGVITLDDGRDIKFDASACTMVPEEGAAVQLRIGPARWGGGFKALHVEPRGSSTLFVPAAPPSLDQQIAALQREHLAGALSEHVMAQLVTEVFGGQLGDASLIDVIDAFYARDSGRARTDGYVRFSRPLQQPLADVFAAFAQICGPAAPRAMSWVTRADGAPGSGALEVGMPDGSVRRVEIASSDDVAAVVAVVEDALRMAGDARRVYALQAGPGRHAYLVLAADRAKRLATVLPFAASPHARS